MSTMDSVTVKSRDQNSHPSNGRENIEYGGGLSVLERNSLAGTWDSLIRERGLRLSARGQTHFVYIKAPGELFNYQAMRGDPLMQGGESPPIVSVVCERFGPECLYLESPDAEALQFLLWKHLVVN